jgi:hypothetical protein
LPDGPASVNQPSRADDEKTQLSEACDIS